MPLRCPFCNASEYARIDAVDESGKSLVLVMFDCPFYFRFGLDQTGRDESMQFLLDGWRLQNGEDWLNSLGTVIRERELRGIERNKSELRKGNEELAD